jgi:hypothetical protein
MARKATTVEKAKRSAPLLGVAGLLALALPSSGLAVVTLTGNAPSLQAAAIGVFTPASVDPELAARVADISTKRGIRFTPAGAAAVKTDRTVTVAVRVDEETAKAISVRSAISAAPGKGQGGIAGLRASRSDLGLARGYQSFARQVELPKTVRDLKAPDLSEFKPAGPTAKDKPSRLQPRIELEDREIDTRSDRLDRRRNLIPGLVGLDLHLTGVKDDMGIGQDAVTLNNDAGSRALAGSLFGPWFVGVGIANGGENFDDGVFDRRGFRTVGARVGGSFSGAGRECYRPNSGDGQGSQGETAEQAG